MSVLLYIVVSLLVSCANGALGLGQYVLATELPNRPKIPSVTYDLEETELLTLPHQFWGLDPVLLGIFIPIFIFLLVRM